MITVSIDINGRTILARSARNSSKIDSRGYTIYNVDTGDKIKHKREDGAVKLCIKMLKTIKEM